MYTARQNVKRTTCAQDDVEKRPGPMLRQLSVTITDRAKRVEPLFHAAILEYAPIPVTRVEVILYEL